MKSECRYITSKPLKPIVQDYMWPVWCAEAWIPTVSLLKIPGSMLITLQNTSKSSFVLSRYRQQVVGSCAVFGTSANGKAGGRKRRVQLPVSIFLFRGVSGNLNQKKRGKLPISRRYDLLPLLPSDPDGLDRELAVWNLPHVILQSVWSYGDSNPRGMPSQEQRRRSTSILPIYQRVQGSAKPLYYDSATAMRSREAWPRKNNAGDPLQYFQSIKEYQVLQNHWTMITVRRFARARNDV